MRHSFLLVLLFFSLAVQAQQPENIPLSVSVNMNNPPSEAQLQTSRKAIAMLSRRIQANPEQAELYTERAMAYYFAHLHMAAIGDFNRAIALGSAGSDNFLFRGLSKLRTGKHYAVSGCEDLKMAREKGDKSLDVESFKKQCPDF